MKKLNMASVPTAIIAGMRRPKMSMGSSNTPPPSPVNPIRVPTMNPISIFASNSSMLFLSMFAVQSVFNGFSIQFAKGRAGVAARPMS